MARPGLKPFYRSAAWRAVRDEALRRDHFTCQICGGRAREVHHIIELDEINVNDKNISLNVNMLQSLCHECHTRLTGAEKGQGDRKYYFDQDGMPRAYPPDGAK